jgi:hypothetical protein
MAEPAVPQSVRRGVVRIVESEDPMPPPTALTDTHPDTPHIEPFGQRRRGERPQWITRSNTLYWIRPSDLP